MLKPMFPQTFDQMLARAKANMPKRRKRPDDEEHRIQCACVNWFRLQYPQHAHNLFAVPNGGKRDKTTAAKLKAEGALPGVSDLILLLPNSRYHAMLIEMKTDTGRQSDSQRKWQQSIQADGYYYVVCRSVEDFIEEVTFYID